MSTENVIVRDAEGFFVVEGNTFFAVNGEAEEGPAVSKNPGTHVRTASGPGRSLHYPSLRGGSPKRRLNADRRMYGGEKSDATIVAMKPANNAWMTTGRSRWSQGSHPRGKRKAGFMPDSGPDYVDLSKSCGLSATVGAQVYRLRLEVGFPHFLTSCAGARPAGRAVCVNAHARICAGPQGKPWGYRDGVPWSVVDL